MASPRSTSDESWISTEEISRMIDNFTSFRIKDSTRKIYLRVWRQFNQFFIRLDQKPGNWESRITLFIGYLISQGKHSQTLRSYISAIKGILAEIKVKLNQDQFMLSALTRACKFKNDHAFIRLLIWSKMLRIILEKMYKYFMDKGQVYLAIMYCALFSKAYFGLFRVGELMSGSHLV